jgi:hypothetical protein
MKRWFHVFFLLMFEALSVRRNAHVRFQVLFALLIDVAVASRLGTVIYGSYQKSHARSVELILALPHDTLVTGPGRGPL